RAGDRRYRLAVQGFGRSVAGADSDALVRGQVFAFQTRRPLLLHGPDPARRRACGVVVDVAVQFLSGAIGLVHADIAVPGADSDSGGTAHQRIRIHRGAVAPTLAASLRPARPGTAGYAAIRIHSPGLLQRAAGHGDADAGFTGRAGL